MGQVTALALQTQVVHILHLPAGITRDDPRVVYIGRANNRYRLRASKWANLFTIGRHGNRDEVCDQYKWWLMQPEQAELYACLPELEGKFLACWCWPERCHGHALASELMAMFLEVREGQR